MAEKMQRWDRPPSVEESFCRPGFVVMATVDPAAGKVEWGEGVTDADKKLLQGLFPLAFPPHG